MKKTPAARKFYRSLPPEKKILKQLDDKYDEEKNYIRFCLEALK